MTRGVQAAKEPVSSEELGMTRGVQVAKEPFQAQQAASNLESDHRLHLR